MRNTFDQKQCNSSRRDRGASQFLATIRIARARRRFGVSSVWHDCDMVRFLCDKIIQVSLNAMGMRFPGGTRGDVDWGERCATADMSVVVDTLTL